MNPPKLQERFIMAFWSIRFVKQHNKSRKKQDTGSGSIMTSKRWPPMGKD